MWTLLARQAAVSFAPQGKMCLRPLQPALAMGADAVFGFGWTESRRLLSSTGKKLIVNESIPGNSVRLIQTDPETGKKSHEVMSKQAALDLAKKLNLDLVGVDLTSDPPVCRLDSAGKAIMEIKKKERLVRATQRATSMKELLVSIGIDANDITTKMKRAKEFLAEGHPVKLSVLPRKFKRFSGRKTKSALATAREDSSALNDLDQITLHILSSLESVNATIQQKDMFNEVPIGSAQANRANRQASKANWSPPLRGGQNRSHGTASEAKAKIPKDADDDDEKKDDDDDDESEDSEVDDEEEAEEVPVKAPVASGGGGPLMQKIFMKREIMIYPKGKSRVAGENA